MGTTAHVYPVERGWFDGRPVEYYNLGANTPLNPADPSRVLVSPVWVFATGVRDDGAPIPLEGQGNVFASAPGDAGYSDLWQAYFVTPAAGYTPDSLTSAGAVLASGMKIEKRALLVNCPFAPPGSSLGDNSKELLHGWVGGQPVTYFDFGVTSVKPGKVYAFVTGFNPDGTPQLIPGQRFVFDSSRASGGYSDFRVVHWVTVDSAYKADSIRAAEDIDLAKVTPSTMVVNYPQK